MSLVRVLETKKVRQFVSKLFPSMKHMVGKQLDDPNHIELLRILCPHAFRSDRVCIICGVKHEDAYSCPFCKQVCNYVQHTRNYEAAVLRAMKTYPSPLSQRSSSRKSTKSKLTNK